MLGRWIDLGHAHLFSMEKKISRHEDIHGLKIRDDQGYWSQVEEYIGSRTGHQGRSVDEGSAPSSISALRRGQDKGISVPWR